MTTVDLLCCAAGLAAFGFIFHGLTDWFSLDARVARKRRRNHRRVFCKSRRPTVMLSVRTKRA